MFYRFYDMHSGAVRKLARTVYVQADTEAEAVARFTARFGLDPYHVTCEHCGPDFFVMECSLRDIPSTCDVRPLLMVAAPQVLARH